MGSKENYTPALRFHFLTKWFDLFLSSTFPEKEIKQNLIHMCNFDKKNKFEALDFGCGTLTLSMMVKEQYPNVEITGIDIDKKVLEVAKSKLIKKPFVIDLEHFKGGMLPFPDDKFNIVYSTLVFHHIPDNEKEFYFHEIQRVIKPGGLFVMADFGKPSGILQKIAFALFRRLDGKKNNQANVDGLLPDMIRKSGLKSVRESMHKNTLFGTITFISAYK